MSSLSQTFRLVQINFHALNSEQVLFGSEECVRKPRSICYDEPVADLLVPNEHLATLFNEIILLS